MPFAFRRATHAAALLLLVARAVHAQDAAGPPHGHDGKLPLTGGVTSVDGAAGGGLTPWATLATNATDDQFGASAALTGVRTRDFRLVSAAAQVGLGDRVELSLARQDFDAGPVGDALASVLQDPRFGGLHLRQDILGAKLRVLGEAVLDSDRLLPQVALGLEVKQAHAGVLQPVLAAFGARRNGVDAYVSATKLLLAQGLLVDATLRATKANQTGLLGFGATGHERYRLQPEGSVAWLATRHLAAGIELRAKPDNLRDNAQLGQGALRESDWKDVFVAWAPVKPVSITLAFVDLGRIVPGVVARRQTGSYVSAQFSL